MPPISLEVAQSHLDQWLAADVAVAKGQAYQIGQRSLTRVDATEIRNNIDYWSAKVSQLDTASGAGGRRVRFGRLIP